MALTKDTSKPKPQIHTPELVDNWLLVTVFEVIILALLLPALFRLGLLWGLLDIIFIGFLAGAAYTWRKGKPTGYYFLVALYTLSLLAGLAVSITFLTIASVIVSVILLIAAYLAGYLNRRNWHGYSFVVKALMAIIAIVILISAPAELRSRIYMLLAFLALYLFSSGAVRFYFGHTFAELDQPDLLAYFGYRQPPAVRDRLARLINLPGQWLEVTYRLVDRLFELAARLFSRIPVLKLRGTRGSRPAILEQRPVRFSLILLAVLIFPYLVRLLEGVTSISILISMNVGLLFVVLALGLNIVVGFAGLLDLGYAAFFAIGAYTVGIFTWPNLGLEWSFWLVTLISIVVAAIFGMIIGAPTLRLRGDYLAIVTLAFGEIVPRAIRELWDIKIRIPFTDIYLISKEGFFYNSQGAFIEGFNLTNGPQGMNPVGRPVLFGHEIGTNALSLGPIDIPAPVQWYLLIVVMGGLVLLASHRLEHSRLGRAWMAIREDETAADAMGVDPIRTKLLAFALGASFSGFAGSIYAGMIQAIFPELFSFLVSIFLLIIVIVSGMGNIWGVLIGGLIIALFDRVALAQIVPQFVPGGDILQSWRWVMYAAGLIAIMVLRPEGLFPSSARKAELHEAEDELSEEEVVLILEREKHGAT